MQNALFEPAPFDPGLPVAARGTEGSNPAPSTGESAANLTSSIKGAESFMPSKPCEIFRASEIELGTQSFHDFVCALGHTPIAYHTPFNGPICMTRDPWYSACNYDLRDMVVFGVLPDLVHDQGDQLGDGFLFLDTHT
jgi:hypothetical protein